MGYILDYAAVMAKGNKAKAVLTSVELVSTSGNIPWNFKQHQFRTIGAQEVRIPPNLPWGYDWQSHDEWEELFNRIIEGYKTASFSQLDMMRLDIEELIELVGDHFNYDVLYQDRRDYLEWTGSFDDAWGDIPGVLSDLFDELFPHKPPHCSREIIQEWMIENGVGGEPLPNRVMPPSLVEILEAMLVKAKFDEKKVIDV
jgi:hypothetical protein